MLKALLELRPGHLIDVNIETALPIGTLVSGPSGIAGLLSGAKHFAEGTRSDPCG